MSKMQRVGFLGFGAMAQAMAKGWLRSGALVGERVFACAKHFEKLRETAAPMGAIPCEGPAEVVSQSDLVILAVKPDVVRELLLPLAHPLAGKLLVSVASGWDFDKLDLLLPQAHHLSVMPNTPVAVNEGVLLLEERHNLSPAEHEAVCALLRALGHVETLPVGQFSTAGVLSGCGPAWAAMFLEALGDAAVSHGLPRQTAYRLAAQMLAGTGKLQLETGEHPGVMKDAVCSPAGTTIAGVKALEENGFRGTVIHAVDAVIQRKRNLQKS